ncbi:MAG: diguanylate cyclase [Pseudomonadota bacterium]
MGHWFFSLMALIGAQREGSLARRAAFVGWMSAPVYLLFSLWMLGGCLLAAREPGLDVRVLGYATLYGFTMTFAWVALALRGLWLDQQRRPDAAYTHVVLWCYALTSALTCYFVGTLSIISGLVMMGAPLIGMMLFPMRRILIVFGSSLALLLAASVASALDRLPYAPIIDAGLAAGESPSLYYALSGIAGAGLYAVYEALIMMALVSAWHFREAGVLRLSQIDTLTGIANRRHIIGELETLLDAHAPANEPVAVVMVDIDHFKQINDRHGHIAGDRALAAAAEALRHCLRSSDRIGRYGGEEFLIVLPGATADAAREIAERCRLAVCAAGIDAGEVTITLTASLGVSSRPAREVRDADHIINLADEAMYLAKQGGRNRVVIA